MEPSAAMAQKMAALAALGFQRVEAAPFEIESIPVGRGRHKVTCTQPSMGTLVSVTAIHGSVDLVQEAAGRAFQEMDRVVDLLNRYDPGSALSCLNAEGAILGPPPELATVVAESLHFNQKSRGLFDPTVQPLVDLLRSRMGSPQLVHEDEPDAEIRDILDLVDAGSVDQTPRAIRLSKDGMGLTLDGIAKGYVVDLMAAVLGHHGLEDFLINAGGDIRSSGHREDGEAWRVAVQDPEKRGDFPDVIGLSNGSVATSGSYEIYFDRERTFHHIVSGRSGSSPQLSQSVSVVAPHSHDG